MKYVVGDSAVGKARPRRSFWRLFAAADFEYRLVC